MTDNATRIAGGLLLLLGLWVAVYWTWPAAEPKTSFAGTSIETGSGVNGGKPAPIAVPPLVRPGETGDTSRSQDPTPTPPEPKGPEPVRPPAGADGGSSGPQLVPPQFVTHTVTEGETLGKISKKYFGTDAYASAIARANPFMDPTRMKPGRTIRVPKDPGNIQGKVEEPAKGPKGSGSEYVVQAGDSLSKIAKTVYNDERLANKIFEANKDRLPSPDKLKLGQKLRIPPKND